MKLADFLSERGMSQTEFAAAIGVSQVAVSRYLAGQRMPRIEQLSRIRQFTQGAVTADDFVPVSEAAE